MASVDSLPPDQRAVIQLVLQRGRSYDDIASMLSIDRAAVRQRALDGFDALGPSHSIPDPQRALLTDYMLGQLPGPVADQVRERLAASPPERAWLRVVASEITSLASSPLPEIPVASSQPSSPMPAPPAAEPEDAPAPRAAPTAPRRAPRREPALADRRSRGREIGLGDGDPATSRRGGAILLAVGGVIVAAVIAVVLVLVLSGGGGKSQQAASHTGTTQTTASTPTTSTTSNRAKLLGQVNLVSPTGTKGRAGVAQVISQGTTIGVVIVAQGVPANTKTNAYAVWLYNSAADSKLVGFVTQRVGSSGKLQTEGPMPANASHYRQMLVTLETQSKPKAPGPIVLEGSLKLS